MTVVEEGDKASFSGVKIRQALGPMARKIACEPSKLTCKFLGDSDSIIRLINEIRKSWPLKDWKYDIKGQNDPWHFLLILTPAHSIEWYLRYRNKEILNSASEIKM